MFTLYFSIIALQNLFLNDFLLILVFCSHQHNFFSLIRKAEAPVIVLFSLSFCRVGLTFNDLLPEDAKSYDKMRPPKKDGQATTVYFHVTVMGLDSIDETSMVTKIKNLNIQMI
jgi:hypothetical protein